jgi:hypothetical protein
MALDRQSIALPGVNDNTAQTRFELALDLWATGVALRRQSIRREHPAVSEVHIERLLDEWLAERPGAEHGDGPQPGP